MPKTRGPRVVRFIDDNCVHADGPLIGQPLKLHPFWRQVIFELFEVIPDGEGGWRRRYSEAYISVPKGNAKTTTLAALGLYFLLADGDPASFVVSAAASEEQGANLLYGAAKKMCELSPTLKAVTEPFDKEILVPSLPRARMKNLTSKSGTNDGLDCRACLLDELHEWKGQRGRDMYHVLAGSLKTRRDAMLIAITTAGYDQESICYDRYAYGKKVQTGEIDDPSFYYKVIEAPEDCDYRDPKVWALCNPLLGVSVRPEYIDGRVKREPESVVRRYNLNQWVAAENIWIPYGAWDKCLDETLELDPALPLFVGIDIAKRIDSSALAIVQKRETESGPRYVCRSIIWENPYREDDPRCNDWRMNNNLVVEECRELFKRFPVPACTIDDEVKPGPCFAYDPWRFRPEAEKLTGEGLALLEFPQSDSRMVPASQALYEAIMTGEIAHSGDAREKRHIQSVTPDQRERGWRISKPKGSGKQIDFAVALAIAVFLAQTQPPTAARSVYEDRGLLVL